MAQVQEGTDVQGAMLPVKLATESLAAGSPVMKLKRAVLMHEQEPVLDAQVISDGGKTLLVVLEANRIVVYQKNAGASFLNREAASPRWVASQTFPIPGGHVVPRDLR